MIKVSIIMPVYNAGCYLEECINDIREQTFSEYEVICVEDCSTDDSVDILERISAQDDRFKVLCNSVRMGAGKTRNIGFEHAVADYVVFLDADDRYEKDMLEEMYQAIVYHNADIAFIEYDRFDSKEGIRHRKPVMRKRTDMYRDQTFQLEDISIDKMLKIGCQPWTRMIRSQFIRDNSIAYQDLKSSNDVYFGFMTMMLAQKMVFVESCDKLLHHRINTSNQISAFRNPYCAYESMYALKEGMKSYLVWEKYYEYFYAIFLGTIRGEFTKCKSEEKRIEFNMFLQNGGFKKIGIGDDSYYEKLDEGYKLSFAIMDICNYSKRWWEEAEKMKYLLTLSANAGKMKKLYKKIAEKGYEICTIGKKFFTDAIQEFFESHGWKTETATVEMSDDENALWIEKNVAENNTIYFLMNQKDCKRIREVKGDEIILLSLSRCFEASETIEIN